MERTKKRGRQTASYWKGEVAAFKESSLTMKGFCAQRGHAYSTFHSHYQKLSESETNPASAAQTEKPLPAFIPIVVSPSKETVSEFKIEVGDGVLLTIPPHFCSEALTKIVGVLKSC